MSAVCPLSGVKRTKSKQRAMSAFDPKRTRAAVFAAVHGRGLLYLAWSLGLESAMKQREFITLIRGADLNR